MTVNVRLFAELRERFGCDRTAMDLPAGTTLGDLLAQLGESAPQVRPLLAKSAVAVGLEMSSLDRVLQGNDEISILPPVSGG